VESVVQKRVLRYCARPPFALERLHALGSTPSLASPESRLVYRFPKPDIHGRTELLRTPLELLQAIAKFVPPPRTSSSLPRCAGSQCQAQAPRGGIRSARARVRGAGYQNRSRCRYRSTRRLRHPPPPRPPSQAPAQT
jgi:hypothetical protein